MKLINLKLKKRSNMEKNIYADAFSRGKMTLGISIHCDAYPNPDANGFCVYYYHKGSRISNNGKLLSRYMANAIIASDVANGHIIVPRHFNGTKGKNFHMLRETAGIWCLVENGFMTNDQDLIYLKRDDFRNNRANAYLEGFYNFVSESGL